MVAVVDHPPTVLVVLMLATVGATVEQGVLLESVQVAAQADIPEQVVKVESLMVVPALAI